eukprot:TRINITY_DN2730_c1_g1_i1.p2 TRINITY_DN2730_c1_g1~~TRINITY_DN2730_c1_g1_i1.p2  ORF type:complete len:216 (+),score=-19.40 TRINITY_DN2730_c1_g1_i1:363-1010(+)
MQRQPQYTRPSVMSSQPKAINVQKHSVFHPHQCSQFKSKHQNTTANKKKQRQTFKTKPLYFTNISKQLKNLSLSLDLDNLATVQTQKTPIVISQDLTQCDQTNKQTNTRYTFLYLETLNITQYTKVTLNYVFYLKHNVLVETPVTRISKSCQDIQPTNRIINLKHESSLTRPTPHKLFTLRYSRRTRFTIQFQQQQMSKMPTNIDKAQKTLSNLF